MLRAERKPLKRGEGYTLQIEVSEDGNGKKKYLHSLYTPREEAKSWAEQIFDRKNLVYLVYGIGALYHIEALMEKIDEEKAEVKVVLTEPFEEILRLAREDERWGRILEREEVFFLSPFEEVRMRDILDTILSEKETEALKLCLYPPYQGLDLISEKLFLETVRNLKVRKILSANTMYKSQDSMPQNMVKNAKYLIHTPRLEVLQNLFAGRTAVIVSAGPSLEKNVDHLKKYQDRVLIISGGRSVRALIDRGIRPHLICSIDFGKENYELYQKMDILDCEAPMLSTWGNHYQIVEEYRGQKVFCNGTGLVGADEQFFGEQISNLSMGYTVASLQMSAAILMGCNTLIFIGQDMAYAAGRRYGEATGGRSHDDAEDSSVFYVRGNVEEKVATSYDLDMFRQYFEERILYQPDCTFVNATEGGAYIKGTKVLSLKEALEIYAGREEKFEQTLDRVLTGSNDREKMDLLRENFKRCREDARKLSDYAGEALALSMKLSLDYHKNKSVLKKLEKVDKKIESVKESTMLSNYFIQEELAAVGKESAENLKDQEIIDDTRKLYDAIRRAAKKMNRLLEEESRILESGSTE